VKIMHIKYIIICFAIIAGAVLVFSLLSNIPRKISTVSVDEIIAICNKLCELKDLSLNYDVEIHNIKSELKIGDIRLNITRVKIVFPLEYDLPFNGTYNGEFFALTEKGIISWIIVKDYGKTLVIKYFYSEASKSRFLSFEEETERVFRGIIAGGIYVDNEYIYKIQGYRDIVLIRIHVKG